MQKVQCCVNLLLQMKLQLDKLRCMQIKVRTVQKVQYSVNLLTTSSRDLNVLHFWPIDFLQVAHRASRSASDRREANLLQTIAFSLFILHWSSVVCVRRIISFAPKK